MDVFTQAWNLADGYKLVVLAILIAVNLGLGLVVALIRKDITLKYVGDFLRSRVVPYVLGYLTVCIVGAVDESLKVSVPVVWGFITAALVGAILVNLKELGFPLPEILAGDSDTSDTPES